MAALRNGKGHDTGNANSGEHESHEAHAAHQDGDKGKTPNLSVDEAVKRKHIVNGLVGIDFGDGRADHGNKSLGFSVGADRKVDV